MALEAVPQLPQLLVVPLPVVLLRLLPPRRRRKRVRFSGHFILSKMLTIYTEKEESDEDMGFGLFD